MERRRGPMVDSISRLLSIIALVAAAGSTYFLHQENQALKKELAAIEGLPAVLEETKKFNRDWNEQLTKVVEQFQQRSGEIINKNEEDLQTRQRNLQTDLAELQSIPIEFSVLEKRLAMLQDIVSTPRLSVMETRLRPIDGQVIPRTVRNDGFADAEVTSVSFMPLRGAQFRLTEPLRRDPTRNQVVIQFNADDNQAQQEGRHRNYERTYLLPDIVVPGKDTVEITVEIQNSKHKDWAWNGELTIEYHDGRKIVIPSITAVFVDNAPESA